MCLGPKSLARFSGRGRRSKPVDCGFAHLIAFFLPRPTSRLQTDIGDALSNLREKMKEAIDSLDEVPRTLALFPETRRWLEERGAPDDLIDLLRAFPFSSHALFGSVSFSDVNQIPEYNDRPESKQLKVNGLLEIGSGLNGDPIVVNLETGTVGYVSHAELWEGTATDIDEIHCDLGLSVAEFFLAAATDKAFPGDFFQALDFKQARG